MHHRFKILLPLLAFCLLLPIHTETSTFSKKISNTYKRYCALPLQYRILIPVVTIGACFCAYKYITTSATPVPTTPVITPVKGSDGVAFVTTRLQPTHNALGIEIQQETPGRYSIGSGHLFVHERLDIVKAQTESIVNAANGGIFGTEGVAKFIQNAVPDRGPYDATVRQTLDYAYQTESIRRFSSGSAIIMPSYYDPSSPIKWIIHAVGPQASERNNVPDRLYSAYFNSLTLAANKGLSSITFPLISSGIFGVHNPDTSSHLNPIMPALRALRDFFAQNPATALDVHFTLYPAKNPDTGIVVQWPTLFIDALNQL